MPVRRLHSGMENKSQTKAWPDEYQPELIQAIARPSAEAGGSASFKAASCYGFDLWRAYDFSWLNEKGHPRVAAASIRVPCDSSLIVESRSLKLYLNSFAQTRLQSDSCVKKTITQDVSAAIQKPVRVRLTSLAELHKKGLQQLPGACIDDCVDSSECLDNAGPELLTTEGDGVENLSVHSHLLRTLCPLTGQPDWGSLFIRYSGPRIRNSSLTAYIVSKRQQACFHETAVEQIFRDILSFCSPKNLSVYACFQRRGGIDINPCRSLEPVDLEIPRTSRQ